MSQSTASYLWVRRLRVPMIPRQGNGFLTPGTCGEGSGAFGPATLIDHAPARISTMRIVSLRSGTRASGEWRPS